MKKRLFIFLVVVLFVFGNVFADFNEGEPSNSIETKYSLGDIIKGWINISLTNEPISSNLESSLGGSINIIEFLDLNSATYNCVPDDCESDYSVNESSARTSETFILNNGEFKIFGFKLTGNNFGGVNDFSINISSNAPESTKPQLFIDLIDLDDNQPEWRAYVPSGNFYNENKGCYDENSDETVNIYIEPYCNKISIPATPKVELGASITEGTGGTASFTMSINGETCSITINSPGKISCTLDLKSTELKEYFVCIQTTKQDSSDDGKYKVGSETTEPCGYASTPSSQRDFNVFAKSGKYNETGSFILNDDELLDSGSFVSDIEQYINTYVRQKYDDKCTNGCVIPIKFTSNINNQQINISNINIDYIKDDVLITEYDKIYNITSIPAVINSDYLQLDLGKANFSIPSTFGNHTLRLELGENRIFSKTIEVEKAPQIQSLNPKTVAAANPTTFLVRVETFNPNVSIVKYEWDFGDGKKETTTTNSTVHTYSQIKAYKLSITVIDSNLAKSTRSFDIRVITPKDAVNDLLKEKIEGLNNVKSFIENQSLFYEKSLKNVLNLNVTESLIASIQQRNASTSNTDSDYIKMMNDLVRLDVPKSIEITERADSFPFYIDQSKINLNVLSQIGDDEYSESKSALYLDAIIAWSLNNVIMKIDYRKFSGVYDDYTDEILNIFEIEVEKNQNRNSSFFLVPKFEKMIFKEDYGEAEISGYYYIELEGDAKNIVFSTTEELSIIELPAFISPRIGRFSAAIEFGKEEREKLSRQTILVLSLILVVFLGFLAYFAMQIWYKRKYEKYLFKSRNDLYNLVSYIQSAKKRGVESNEIQSKLRKIGWNSEQIKYIMKKYAGKRTGMVEIIPFGKIFSIFGKKKGIPSQRNPRFATTRKFNKLT